MKIDERIIRYLDNQMMESERISFESELDESHELNRQLKSWKNNIQHLKVDGSKFENEDYFVNLIPRFRERKIKTWMKKQVKISFAAAGLVVLIACVVFIFIKPNSNNSLEEIVGTMNDSEAYELIDYFNDSFSSNNYSNIDVQSDSLFTSLISSELNIQESDLSRLILVNDVNIENIYSEIKPVEADIIYDQILSKKYF